MSSDPTETDLLMETASIADREIVAQSLPHTMTGPARLLALIDAVRHCSARGIEGSFAECGVWRGGSILAMILTLQQIGEERDIYLFDTFEGMTKPTDADTSPVDDPAMKHWAESGGQPWPVLFGPDSFNLERVRDVVLGTGYPAERVHFIQGPVEKTLPAADPGPLALLRLDTDWYESTRHELVHLFPRLESGGVLIIDDYGHWEGCRQAVDEYFSEEAPRPLLSRIDYTCRIAVKP